MPSLERILSRLPSLYRPEPDAKDLVTTFLRAIGHLLDGVSKESSDVMQAHWAAYADGALFSEWARRSREVAHEPPVQPNDALVEALPYLTDLPRMAALLDRAPWLDPPVSRDHVEDFRRRLSDVVSMYLQGLGTLSAIRLATRIALPITERDAPVGLRARPFTVEEHAALGELSQPVEARGAPVGQVGPLMRWTVDSSSRAAVLPTAFVRGVTPQAGKVDATRRPVIERVNLLDDTGVGLAYDGELLPGQSLALWPEYRSWLGTVAGLRVASSAGSAQTPANSTAPGPWASVEDGPTGDAVAILQAADRFLWVAVNAGGEGSLWRSNGTTWEAVLSALPEVRCLAARGNELLIGLATGVTSLSLFAPGATPPPPIAGLAGPEVRALAVDATGGWWAATSSGAAKLAPDLALSAVGPGVVPTTSTELSCVFVDDDGTVFFGGALGVLQYQVSQDRWFHYAGAAVDEGSPDWLAFDPRASELPRPETVFVPAVLSVRRGRDGALWLGTERGVARYLAREHRRTWTTLLEAYPAVTQAAVRSIAEDERGQLWFATDTGVLVFDGADWWQVQGEQLVRLRSELSVRPPHELGLTELSFWRFVRAGSRWQSLTPSGTAAFVDVSPAAAATVQPAARVVSWTDSVKAELGSFDGNAFTATTDAPAPLRMRIKPDALRIVDGGIPALPRLDPGSSDWRYLALEPDDVPMPRSLPAWTCEGRLLPEPQQGPAPLEGRYLAASAFEQSDQVFAFNPAAEVWMRWSPREPLSVLVRLRRTTPGEVVDPLILDRVFDEVSRVRPLGVRLGLAVDDEIVRVGTRAGA